MIALLLFATCVAADWDLQSIPNPTTDPAACGRAHVASSRVCDPDGVLGVEGGDRVEARLDALLTRAVEWPERSPCSAPDAGVEAAVVVVERLDVGVLSGVDDDASETAVDDATEAFAVGVHDTWGVGSKDCQNGAVLVISRSDRSFHLSTGAALRRGGLVGDDRASKVLERSKPFLRGGDVAGGVLACLDQLETYLDAGPPGWREWLWSALPVIGFFGFFGVCFGLAVVEQMRETQQRSDYAAAGRALDAVEKIREDPKFAGASCPICLEDFSTDGDEGAKKVGADGRPVCGLPCGHGFCRSCVEEWLKKCRGGCPVCRTPIEGAAPAPRPSSSRAAGYGTGGAATGGVVASDPLDEVRFRVGRIHARYPRALPRSFLEDWDRRGFRGPLRADPAFVATAPPSPRSAAAARAAASSATSFASPSRSFGGGRSSGGAGGRW